MKPRFALNLTPEAANLLRRMPDGWEDVGSVRFDAPDLTEALARLRAEAGSLAAGEEIATKVVIPNSQILYTTVQAPGPDRGSRRRQIREGLDGLTPYEVKDLVYDFEIEGDSVRLAVVARETLDEAESFAETHGFNPLSFVAIPEFGQFPREPWFGILSTAQRRLPKGEKVERDAEPIRIVMAAAAVLPPIAGTDDLPDATPEAPAEPAPATVPPADVVDAADADAERALPPVAETDEPASPEAPDRAASDRAEEEPTDEDAVWPSAEELAALTPDHAALALPDPAPGPGPAAFAQDAPPPDEDPAAPPVEEPEELFVPPPLVRAADRARPEVPEPGAVERPVPNARELPPFQPPLQPETTAPSPTADATPGTHRPPLPREAAVSGPDIPEAPYVELEDDEVPAMPPGTFASRRAAAEATTARPAARLTADPKNGRMPPRPVEAAARAPTGRSALPRAAGAPAAEAPARSSAQVTAPGIPGMRARKPVAPPRPAAAAERPAERKEAPGGFPGLGGRPVPTRGKPRFLGLILTLVLLLVLGAVAAWSSYYLASDDAGPEPLALAEALADDIQPDETPSAEAPSTESASDGAAAGAAGTGPASTGTTAPVAASDPTAAVRPAARPEVIEQPAAAAEPAASAPRVASDDAVRTAPTDTPQDEIFLTAMDAAPPSLDAVALPPPPIAPDAAPGMPLPPPPFGVQYEFGADGMIRPSAAGVLAPGEFLLIAGKPPILPPRRPGLETPAAAATPAAAPAPATPPAARPAPGSIFPGTTSPEPQTQTDPAVDRAVQEALSAPATVQDPALAGYRPKPRPALPEPVEPAETAATEEPGPLRTSSLRPRARPSDLDLPTQAQAATLMMAPRADGATDAVATSSGAISPLAISVSRKPEARPNDFSQAIEAAVAAAVQTPRPPVAVAPAAVAAIAPAPRKAAAVRVPPAAAQPEAEEEDEPEVTAAPRIPTRANVAQKATYANSINLSKTNLIGVYGTPSSRYALVRQSNGRYVKVRVGDRIDGGVVAAISSNELRYRKGSRILSLSMPKG